MDSGIYDDCNSKSLDLSTTDSCHYSQLSALDKTLISKIPPIPKLKNPNIHYRCPKCFNFPFIEFIDKTEKIIRHTCACHLKQLINIKDFFDEEKKYMTFLDSTILSKNISNNEDLIKIIGFKCTEHEEDIYKNYEYYCIKCAKNICKECLQNHLDKSHDLIIFDFQNFEIYKKMKKIYDFLDVKDKNEKEINYSDSNVDRDNNKNNNKNKDFQMTLTSKNEPVGGGPKINDNLFLELINIIMNDYINYPNYSHFLNIENIYRFYIKEYTPRKKEVKNEDIQLKYHFGQYDITLRCKGNESIKNIYRQYMSKINPFRKEVKLLYKGKEINADLTIDNTITNEDRERQTMDIFLKEICDIDKIKIKEILCPTCDDNICIDISNYKISFKDCKNRHDHNKVLINRFMDTQKKSDLRCDICHTTSEPEYTLNICVKCKKILCSKCCKNHDISHQMVNYNKRNYVCLVHNNATFQKFCITCKKNCCPNCNEHINHIVKNFKDILVPTEEETFKEYNDLRKNINKLAERIQAIINKLNDFIHSIEVYFKISKEISEGFYSTNMKNYQLITNFLQFRNQNKILKEEINDIMDNLNAVEQFKKIMILDSSLNEFANKYNYITGEIFVNEENRNNYIRIINSYEERKRNSNMNYNKDNSQFLNEKEIKESCKIFIDDKAISFAYFYKFNKTGMHNIKYYFTNN